MFRPEHDLWLPEDEVPKTFTAAYHTRRENRLSSQSVARRVQLGEGAELRGGGNGPTPHLRSGAYDEEASSRKQAKETDTKQKYLYKE